MVAQQDKLESNGKEMRQLEKEKERELFSGFLGERKDVNIVNVEMYGIMLCIKGGLWPLREEHKRQERDRGSKREGEGRGDEEEGRREGGNGASGGTMAEKRGTATGTACPYPSLHPSLHPSTLPSQATL